MKKSTELIHICSADCSVFCSILIMKIARIETRHAECGEMDDL